MPEINEIIDRMVAISNAKKELDDEYDKLEAIVLARFAEDTENTKHKAAMYSSASGTVSVAEADSVKVIYPTMLKEIFGTVYPDMVKEDKTYTLTSTAKKLLAAVYKGEYMRLHGDQSFDKAVSSLPVANEKDRKALLKKLKGRKYDSDVEKLIKIGGFSKEEAADYAYMLSEVANWCDLRNMLQTSGRTSEEDILKIIDCINSAVTVETSPKISLKAVE